MGARENTSNANSHVSQNHPLNGIWQQPPDPSGATLVIYKISVRHGKFLVSATDEEHGSGLKISQVKWDDKAPRLLASILLHSTRHSMF